MPIQCQHELQPLDRESFGRLSYEAYADVLSIREELGRFFDEKHYKRALAMKRSDLLLEVPLQLTHKEFSKTYYLDALLAGGGILEFKAAERTIPQHRAQLLHYLILTEIHHGLLINVRPERVTREFINNAMTGSERRVFQIRRLPQNSTPGVEPFVQALNELLQDWGTGLELSAYEEALTCFLGGTEKVVRPTIVRTASGEIGTQTLRFIDPETAFKLTSLETTTQQASFAKHAQKLVNHLDIEALLWTNIARRQVTIQLIHHQH